jgi:hypothetical protein
MAVTQEIEIQEPPIRRTGAAMPPELQKRARSKRDRAQHARMIGMRHRRDSTAAGVTNKTIMKLLVLTIALCSACLGQSPLEIPFPAGDNAYVRVDVPEFPLYDVSFAHADEPGILRISSDPLPDSYESSLPANLQLVHAPTNHFTLKITGGGRIRGPVTLCGKLGGYYVPQQERWTRLIQWKGSSRNFEDLTTLIEYGNGTVCGQIPTFNEVAGETVAIAAGDFTFTPKGTDIRVETIGTTFDYRTVPVLVRFQNVTVSGATTDSITMDGLIYPAGYKRAIGQNWWTQYVIETTAKSSGSAKVCIPFIGTTEGAEYRLAYSVNKQTRLKLLPPADPEPIGDPVNGGSYPSICGQLPSFGSGLGIFAAAERLP